MATIRPNNFPTIDTWLVKNGHAISIKSLDINAKTYQNPSRLKSIISTYLKKLGRFKEAKHARLKITPEEIQQKTLKLVVPSLGNATQKEILTVWARQQAKKLGLLLELVQDKGYETAT